MQITQLDSIMDKLPQAEQCELSKQLEQPLDVGEFMATHQVPKLNPRTVESLVPLDAAMFGATFKQQNKDGSVTTINPGGWQCKIKESDSAHYHSQIDNDESKEVVLRKIISAVIANENTFSSETVWSYAKLSSHLGFHFVTNGANRIFQEMCEAQKIRCVNNFYEPFTYSK